MARGLFGDTGGGSRPPQVSPRPAPTGGGGGGSGEGGGGSSGIAALPEYLGGMFPAFMPVGFPTISAANYNFVDPMQFAQTFSNFNRGEIRTNFNAAKDFALESLDTELRGLRSYAPAAAALKRSEISADNLFNQTQRTRQVNQALPGVSGDLGAQRERARAYAEGRIPDRVTDRALELGVRSNAADTASFGGFGARSGQGRKTSDLMSAAERVQLSQYGDQLLTQNIGTKAGLYLAPTEYSNAGTEIRATPEVGAGRLTYQGLGVFNEATLLSPSQALTAKIGQEQFKTNLEQRTKEFNATGQYDAAKFNSAGAFTAGLGAFNYEVQYANAEQAANQANLNFAAGLQMQGIQSEGFNAGLGSGQAAQTIQATSQGIGAISGALGTANSIFGTGSQSGVSATSVDTTPSQSNAAPLTDSDFRLGRSAPVASAPSASFDASSPSGLRISQGAPAPAGYMPIASNNDGSVSLASVPSYEKELDRFTRSSGFASGSVNIKNAALADRNIANTTGLSFLPVESFKPIATIGTGQQVYSLPAAAQNGNVGAGRDNINNLAVLLATMGVTDPSVMAELGNISEYSSDPEFLASLDNMLNLKGQGAVSQTILNKLTGGKPLSTETDEGQQIAFGAHRLGELWGGLSPQQKSMALTSLSSQVIKQKTGKDINNELVPGSDKSPVGGLRVGDALNLTMQGVNGHALARNWKDLSVIGHMATGTNGVSEIARIADATGLLGYGPQGSAVPVEPHFLQKLGAKPAPVLGIGAVVFDAPDLVPQHYDIVSETDQGVVAMPKNLAHTSPLRSGGAPALSFKKSRDVAARQHPAQRAWGEAPSQAIRGSAGGSAMISGLNLMADANPNLLGSIAAHSLFVNTMGA